MRQFNFDGLFLPPFSRLDLLLYASRHEKRRFFLGSDYPLIKLLGVSQILHLRHPLFSNLLGGEKEDYAGYTESQKTERQKNSDEEISGDEASGGEKFGRGSFNGEKINYRALPTSCYCG